MTVSNPSIAFDRFIRLEWIAQALKVRSGQIAVDEFEDYLDRAGLGKEARVKLKTKLKVLCLEPRPNFENFLSRGIQITGSTPSITTCWLDPPTLKSKYWLFATRYGREASK